MAELRPKQQEVLEPLRARFIHADPPGTGKTPVGLRWLRAHEAETSLLVTPTNVLRHWPKLAETWFPELTCVVIPTKTPRAKRQTLRDALWHIDGPRALVVPYSVLREDQEALKAIAWDAFLADEAHKLKGRGNLVQKAAVKISRRTAAVDLVTGSPILNGAEEIWSLMHIIDPRHWPSFWRWAGEHFEIEQTTFYGKVARPVTLIGDPLPGAIEAIQAELGPLLVMRDEDELELEMPDIVQTFYDVDLSPRERKIYDQLVKHNWVKEGDTIIQTSNTAALNTRLRQLSSEWNQLLGELEAGTKVKAAVELIEDLHPRSVVVFVEYKQTGYSLAAELHKRKIAAVHFNGDMNDDERETSKAQFIDRQVPVLIGTYGAMAEGVDGLQKVSHHTVMIDLHYVPEIKKQAVGRTRRDGQAEPTVYIHNIVARGTIDQSIEETVESKRDVRDALFGRTVASVVHPTNH